MTDPVFGMGETTTAVGPGDSSDNKSAFRPHEELNQTEHANQRYSAESGNDEPSSVRTSSLSVTSSSLSLRAKERRAHRVRFYRNGDRFFKGMVFAVSTDRFRSFENLLASLTASPLCDSRVMPHGVRHIFTIDGAQKVDTLDAIKEGQSYVCASSEVFRSLDYSRNEDPSWNTSRASVSPRRAEYDVTPHKHRTASSNSANRNRMSESKSAQVMTPTKKKQYDEYQRSFVVPRLITVLKHGKRPREAVRLVLNKKTAQTFDQVMHDIGASIKLDCGFIKKLYAISGKLVTCLADFFGDDTIFLACSKEIVMKDLILDKAEVRQVRAYMPFSSRSKDRITLRHRSSRHDSRHSDGHDSLSQVSSGSCNTANFEEKQNDDVSSFQTEDGKVDISKISMPELLTMKYDVGALIGTGNFAVVLECKDKNTKRKYALKIINRNSCKGREKMLDNEVRILRRMKHPNIIRLIEDYSHQHRIFYVMELVKGGDLFDAIASSNKYTEQDAGGILFNLASALNYLHSMDIVHRDVKPENLLIRQHEDGSKSLKLGDFGLATEVHSPLFTVCGTPTYVAPEVIAETGYGVKIDIWSAGVITYILLCGFPPFANESDNQSDLFDMILAANYSFPKRYWKDISEQAKSLITRMLELDPDTRLSAKEVLEDQWVAANTTYEADLRRMVKNGLNTHFRRGDRPVARNAGVQIIATSACDKSSKFFKGKKSMQEPTAQEPTAQEPETHET